MGQVVGDGIINRIAKFCQLVLTSRVSLQLIETYAEKDSRVTSVLSRKERHDRSEMFSVGRERVARAMPDI